jgi:predicted aconitase with swiveling domain
VVLDEPLSLWGGMDPESGRLIDQRHPQVGAELAGRILVMPSGRGSSSSSSVLAEAIRARTAPAGIVLSEPDGIIALGALIARELYGRSIPVIVLPPIGYAAIETGDDVAIASGRVTLVRG